MSKLICMGEALIDFMPGKEELSFQGKAGGAPSNVCASVGKLGGEAYYLGMMAKDSFGEFLLDKLKACNVKTDYIEFTSKAGTGLAFVTHDKHGDRSFSFYRDPCADLLLDKSSVKDDMFSQGDVLHFCSVDLVDSPTKDAHTRAIEFARKNGAYVSFDVNLRLNIWKDDEKCLRVVREYLQYADIVKVTDEELSLITNEADETKANKKLLEIAANAKLVFVTAGEKGSYVYDRKLNKKSVKPIPTNVVDTTGAGDCYSGIVIYNLLNREDKNKETLTIEEGEKYMHMANKGCAVVVSKYGAMESMPTLEEIR